MTVNIGLVTSEALILGCDSIATSTRTVIDPFAAGIALDASQKPLKDKDGNLTISLSPDRFESFVVDVMPGVAKMFPIYDLNNTFVAATTAGLATLRDRAIRSIAADFLDHQTTLKRQFAQVKAVAEAFKNYVKKEYEGQHSGSSIDRKYWDDLKFLVGGIGKNDKMPSLYRIDVKEDLVVEQFAQGEHGVAWEGQSDSVERVIRGYDSVVRAQIEREIDQEFDTYRDRMTDAVVRIANEVLTKLGATIPKGVDLSLPHPPKAKLSWDKATASIPYGSLSTQRAIDFVSFLVKLQAGPQRFSRGIATVGGRTHIGVVSKNNVRLLNEPDLAHTDIGFSDDS
jgi:hypothetical protein